MKSTKNRDKVLIQIQIKIIKSEKKKKGSSLGVGQK